MAEFLAMKNSQERFAYVVRRGRQYHGLPPEEKNDGTLIKSCLAKAWFVADFADGRCQFRVDSESAIVKGIAVILCEFYNGRTPEEILSIDPTFLEKAGIDQHLTPNRRNSLSKIWERIHSFANEHRKGASLPGAKS